MDPRLRGAWPWFVRDMVSECREERDIADRGGVLSVLRTELLAEPDWEEFEDVADGGPRGRVMGIGLELIFE